MYTSVLGLQQQPPQKPLKCVQKPSTAAVQGKEKNTKKQWAFWLHVLSTLDAVKGHQDSRAEPPQLPAQQNGSDGQGEGGERAGATSLSLGVMDSVLPAEEFGRGPCP